MSLFRLSRTTKRRKGGGGGGGIKIKSFELRVKSFFAIGSVSLRSFGTIDLVFCSVMWGGGRAPGPSGCGWQGIEEAGKKSLLASGFLLSGCNACDFQRDTN